MNKIHHVIASDGRTLLTTEELATVLSLSAQSIRKRYAQTGSYFELRPVKLPNRRLLWPADALAQLINRSTRSSV
ncbi:helix-turn-helix domain-containing protein [Burkholderia cenocepacia]|uniref:helix-turn-helix domain-containing protein n=1 Tax=Burkholderia cenocepacia TaxID=95486 RepID=UPI002AB7AE99|nr:helix-turn-helix domain-containing protein [Burkholderia cenocepacia]